MLCLRHDGFENEARLYVRTPRGEAWIARMPRLSPEERLDWKLWVRAHPGDVARSTKSPLRLDVESRLRSWLLQRYRRCLFTLTFAELWRIAECERRRAT